MPANAIPKPSEETLSAFAKELDEIKAKVMQDIGEKDAKYIRNLIRAQRYLVIIGTGLILLGFNPICLITGIILLSLAKILDNMEIGHNVMHGQYDWMNDPEINSQSHDWESICCPDSWRKTHNYEHHTYTNILGKDRDFGYGAYRMSADMDWEPRHRWQLPFYIAMAILFQWGLGLHDMESERIEKGEITAESKAEVYRIFKLRAARHVFKDYLFFPFIGLLTGPGFWTVALAMLLTNTARNVWASAVIFCGHFPDGVYTFSEEECENESQGAWYYRQILGSCNINGGKWMHLMTGHLSLQVEHHLFPDIPARRYPEIAPKVKAICARYNIPYHSGPMLTQYFSVLKILHRYSKQPDKTNTLSAA